MIDRRTWLGGFLLISLGLLIYLPAMQGGWLWDDRDRLIDNPIIHSPEGYWKVWATSDPQGNYYPLSSEFEWLEWRLWSDHTIGYHLVSLALHLTSGLLLWRLFARLGLSLAWVGALVFITHPLMVESVAWISEIKNTLSLPPLLMAALAWLDYNEKGRPDSYRGALVWFALSLAAKTAGLMFPVFLIVGAWWKHGKLDVKDWRAVTPFLAMALAAGIVTLWPPHLGGTRATAAPAWNLAACLASVGWTTLFLFGKCFVPVRLMADYPGFAITQPTTFDLLPWLLLVASVGLLGLAWRRSAWTRWILLGLGFFLLNLLPVLIYLGKNYEEMTWSLDHLVYVPIIGLIWAIIAALNGFHPPAPVRRLGTGAIAAVLLAFTWGSHSYARVFTGPDDLWADLLQRDPANWRAHLDSGKSEFDQHRTANAVAQLQKAIELKPTSDQAYFYLGKALEREGRADEATQSFLQAVRLNPHETRPYIELAAIMCSAKNFPEAEKYLNQAWAQTPDEPSSIAVLAGIMMQAGRKQEAMELYRKALSMDPDVEQVRYNYGVALLQAKDSRGAAEQFQAAIDLNDKFEPSHENLGVALAQTGAVADAIEQFQAALAIDPNDLDARDNLGLALAQTGQLTAAMDQFKTALQINPNDARARSSLAKLESLQNAPAKTHSP